MNEKLFIVIPAYNEEDNIEDVVKSWYPLLKKTSYDSRLVIADYGSKDKTHQLLLSLKNHDYPQLEILENNNQFHGPKLIALYNYAISQDADWIFQTDSDGQTNPLEFNQFWKLRHKYDVILGHRNKRGDGISRLFVSKCVCLLLRFYFGVKLPDANAPFRLMKKDVLKKYISSFDESYNLPNIMLSTFFVYYKENITFKKITFKPRQGGINSINIPKIIKIGYNALKDFKQFKKNMRS